MTFEEFLQLIHPVPERDKSFLKAWGYEQWHIRAFKQDYEQARIIYQHPYNMCRLAEIGSSGQEIANWLKANERPLVKAKREWRGFVWRWVEKGLVGVSVWEEQCGHFCIFPKLPGLLTEQFIGWCPNEDLEILDIVFESDEQVCTLAAKSIAT